MEDAFGFVRMLVCEGLINYEITEVLEQEQEKDNWE